MELNELLYRLTIAVNLLNNNIGNAGDINESDSLVSILKDVKMEIGQLSAEISDLSRSLDKHREELYDLTNKLDKSPSS